MSRPFRFGRLLGALFIVLSAPAPSSGVIESQCRGNCRDGGVVTCESDCDGNGRVTVDELLTQVNIAQEALPADACPNRCEVVDVGCLVRGVGAALNGCGLRALLDQCRGAGIVQPTYGSGSVIRLRRATTEPTEAVPSCGCAEPTGVAWLRMVAPITGTAIVTVTDPGSAIALGAYSPRCATAEERACVSVAADGSGRLTVPVQEEDEVPIAVAVCGAAPEYLQVHFDMCGDSVTSDREECDDGEILDGDGCTADCRFEDLGGIDQRWTGPLGFCGSSSSDSELVPVPTEEGPPVAQIVTPEAGTLAGVDVRLASNLGYGDTLSLLVRAGSVDGPVLARVDQRGPAPHRFSIWHHFRLATPVALQPGQPYALQLAASAPGAAWASVTGDDAPLCTATRYPGGSAIRDGEVRPLSFLFRTYAAAP